MTTRRGGGDWQSSGGPARLPTSTCPACGKVRYLTKKQARAIARRLRGDGHLNAYRCGDFWHLGHLPAQVVSGHWSRDQLGGGR